MAANLCDPATREAQYGQNIAKYLVDLHDAKAVFDFCGGMMFQLVLSDKLRSHLADVAKSSGHGEQPVVFDASKDRMAKTPGYRQDAKADNVRVFHGREVRSVPTAAGGMGFVLHLSYAGAPGEDPEGWTPQELAGYDGWGHDSGRTWRKGERLEREGFAAFRSRFGASAFALHHRSPTPPRSRSRCGERGGGEGGGVGRNPSPPLSNLALLALFYTLIIHNDRLLMEHLHYIILALAANCARVDGAARSSPSPPPPAQRRSRSPNHPARAAPQVLPAPRPGQPALAGGRGRLRGPPGPRPLAPPPPPQSAPRFAPEPVLAAHHPVRCRGVRRPLIAPAPAPTGEGVGCDKILRECPSKP